VDTSLSSEQGIPPAISAACSLASLLERAILCTRQGYYAEGTALFALAREQLSPQHTHLAGVLDALIHNSSCYMQAQQALHSASRRFAEIDAAQQTQLLTLEKWLATLQPAIPAEPFLPAASQLSQNPHRLQPAQLQQPSPPFQPAYSPGKDSDDLPALHITCFGHFEIRRLGKPIALCTSRSGQIILRYLIAQSAHNATTDALMNLLWPDEGEEVAQSRLHIAISVLRRSLNGEYGSVPGRGYILCKNRTYLLNPAVSLSSDVEEFLQYYHAAWQTHQDHIALYERACALYTGPFLTEDTYADWSFLQRERLSRIYLAMCATLSDYYLSEKRYEDATRWATAILHENRCDEAAHRQLIQIYAAQGHRSEALQQYHRCERTLQQELAVQPLPETTLLFQSLLTNEPFPKP
jgi:DNA-binding SARP family transcriptional activator